MRTRRCFAFGLSSALHLLAVVMVVRLAARTSLVPMPDAGASSPTVVVVQSVDASALRRDEHADSRTKDPAPDDLGIHLEDGASNLDLPGFRFDFRKVADRASSLFPLLTRSLSLDRLTASPRGEGRARLANPFAQAEQTEETKPPLRLGDAALQSLIDTSWSRRDRWLRFEPIVALAGAYSPDEGRLPALLEGYVAQNGLQPYVDTTIRDPRLWTQLGIAADHADFIDFIGRYASQHPSTRSTTALLFLLDKIAQGSFDALATLLDTDPPEDLQWTRRANPGAFNALVTIRDYYRAQLERRDLASHGALRTYYDGVRLSILTSILRTTPHGYRAGDARFLIGAIYWKEGRAADALRVWRDMTIDPEDSYAIACSEILAAMRTSDGKRLNAHIDGILNSEHGHWIMFSLDRLRRFGYHVDTF
jgi:hypothetical protein